MTDVNDLQSMERFINKKIEPLNKQISMLQIELIGVKKQLSIPLVNQRSELLIAWEQYKLANWYESEAIDVEKMLMSQFLAIYCG